MWGRLTELFQWPAIVISGLFCLATWIITEALTGAPFASIPIAIGAGVLYLQVLASQVVRSSENERDEALPLLQAALPKLHVGAPLEAAFIAAAQEAPNSTALRVSAFCARARQGLDTPSVEVEGGVMAQAIIAMIRSATVNGGDVGRPFASLASMIETDQRLRRKQQIATLHVRAQANALVGIAVIILALALFGNAASLSFLHETVQGRLMVLFAATMMLWGYLIISILTARISRV